MQRHVPTAALAALAAAVVLTTATSAAARTATGAVTGSGAAPTPGAARGLLKCFAEVPGVTPRGVPATFHYEGGKGRTVNRGPGDLGYQPRDLAFPHYAATALSPSRVAARRASTVTSYWFTISGSELREVTEVDRRDRRGLLVSATYSTRVVRRHWDGVRQVSIGEDRAHLYALTNTDQLLRYRFSGKDGNADVKLDTTVGVGFGSIGTLEYARTSTEDGVRSDVFLATDADSGELLEIAVPVDDPTAYTRTTLVTEGWTDLRSVGRVASCLNPVSGRDYDGIVSVDLDGNVRLWTDRDGRDADGSDIVRRGVLKDVWRPMAYSD